MRAKFDLNQSVKTKDINLIGTISGIFISGRGIEYSVRFLKDFDFKELYFTEDELEEIKDGDGEKVVGFSIRKLSGIQVANLKEKTQKKGQNDTIN